MAKKVDVKLEKLGGWDQYADASIQNAASSIYRHAESTTDRARDWYWKSIKAKRLASLTIRFCGFMLLVFGVVLPILAGLSSDTATRLWLTQFAVAALAVAGLLQAADRVFGWSSGWLRYMTTVTAMEGMTLKFELDWANYMINRNKSLSGDDKRPLFELAQHFENAITKLVSDETDKWVAEFNSGLALMNDLVKAQRESAERTVEVARAAVATQESTAAARDKAAQPGSIEVSIVHRGEPVPVRLSLDGSKDEEFTGRVWARPQVTPGHHTVQVTTVAPPVQAVQRIAEVSANGVARLEIRLS